MTRRRSWAAGIIAGVLLGVSILVIAFDWNWFKGPVESIFSAIFGRNFEIHGDLDAEFALSPRIVMRDVTVDNADWGSGPHMLEAERFGFVIDLWQLAFDDRLDVTDVHFERPDVLVERSGDGELNWQSAFGEGGEQEGRPRPPQIGAISARGGAITYHGPQVERGARIALDQLDGHLGNATEPVTLQATGSMSDRPLTLDVEVGSLVDLQGGRSPYPVEVALGVGDTSIALAGSITRPLQLEAADLELDVDSPDLGPLLAVFDQAPDQALPASVSGRLVHQERVWALMDLDAEAGASALEGRIGVDLAEQPLLLKADLESGRLDLDRLIAIARSISPSTTKAEAGSATTWLAGDGIARPERLLPDIRTEIELRGRDVAYRGWHFNELTIDAALSEQRPDVRVHGTGRIEDAPLSLELSLGPRDGGDGAGTPYAVEASLEAGETTAELSGTLPDSGSLSGLTARFDVASPKPSTVLGILDWPDPDLPAVELAGRIARDGEVWTLSDLSARVDRSDVAGRVRVDLAGDVPMVDAELDSDELHVDDVRTLLGNRARQVTDAATKDLPVPEPDGTSPPLLSGGRIDPRALPGLQADVRWDVAQLSGPELWLEDVAFRGRLRDDRVPAIALETSGRFRGETVQVDLALGAPESEAPLAEGYPVDVLIEAGASRLDLSGIVERPMEFGGLSLKLDASSGDLAKWLGVAGVDVPQLPQVQLIGQVVRDGNVWTSPDAYLEVGESNLFGKVAVDLGRERPSITAALQSNRLMASDFQAVASAGGGDGSDGGSFVSARGIDLGALPEIDADASLRADYLRVDPVRLDRLRAGLHLRDRILVLDLSGDGKFRDQPLTLEAHLGRESSLDPDARYPVSVELSTGPTLAQLSGTVGRPFDFSDTDVDVVFEGPNLDRLGDILQLSLPSTPPYRLTGNLSHRKDRWRLAGLDGRIADSDIAGQVTVDLAGERPTIVAELRTNRLDFDDLGTLVGAPPGVDGEETASERQQRLAARQAAEGGVLPEAALSVEDLRAVDADLHYRAENVQARGVPLTGLELDAGLEDGVLRIDPLRFQLARGSLGASLTLDGQVDPMRTEVDVRLKQARLSDLLNMFGVEVPGLGQQRAAEGRLVARADLTARGNSVAEAADTADGRIGMLMNDGEIGALLLEAAGIDVGEVLALVFSEEDPADEMVPVRCFLADAAVENGVIAVEALVLDTADSRVTGQGRIDLGEETLDLRFLAHPKDPSVLSASVPVVVRGGFQDLSIGPAGDELAEKAAAALGLGIVVPVVGAVIPFVEPGLADDTACARLLATMEAEVNGADGEQRN